MIYADEPTWYNTPMNEGINEITYYFWSSILTVNAILLSVLIAISIVKPITDTFSKWAIIIIVLSLLFSSTLIVKNFQWKRDMMLHQESEVTSQKIIDNEKYATLLLLPAALMIFAFLLKIFFSN